MKAKEYSKEEKIEYWENELRNWNEIIRFLRKKRKFVEDKLRSLSPNGNVEIKD